jgi:hypothetical protein
LLLFGVYANVEKYVILNKTQKETYV